MTRQKTISMANRRFLIEGDPQDPYFENVENIASAQLLFSTWLQEQIKEDSVIIDIGGNIGVTAMMFSCLVPRGHVYVFEASIENAAFLKRNIEINDIKNCSIVIAAINNKPGLVRVQGSGSSAHVAVDQSGQPQEGSVVANTLDYFVKYLNIDRVDFIKIDVEGSEPSVLEGSSDTIHRFRPLIMMEFNAWCLSYIHNFRARDFAYALLNIFETSHFSAGSAQEIPDSSAMLQFLHGNITQRGAVDDLVLRIRPGYHDITFSERSNSEVQ